MTTQQALTPRLTPGERLLLSRSKIVSFMQNDDQILHVLKPVVASYAKSNPVKTLGIAVGIGAAIVVLKPWRLITIGSLLAVLKSRM
jgi:hypothetical protein